ncbi:hypothetical protein A3F34_00880 [Candidatus Roizmanbacteria bacterium RIFCSPHIGHO2_12_FULL_44_10]|uniref:Cell envelope-related transcriptional attenuator domain-containing protein n=1 Tax=Candidatus Roizmanbacteria bacterium RIFCSPHIGHO2_12_FULL_44_10 TaxID=1802054 RepID=A0A1F7I9J3_9BACT|nr:MAG: hypothetical protein A3F34_00880 [Candidatus Roizmanbacteria bacterium RIFCSPHIGHO2_12_FULL_44_10]
MDKRKRAIMAVGSVILILLVLFVVRLGNLYSTINTHSETWSRQIPKEKKDFTILMMGYGGAGHEGAYLTDTMMVFRVDFEKKTALMVSLPRDIWTEIPTESGDEFSRKINSVYQMGLFPKNYPDLKREYKSEQGAGDLVKKVIGDIVGFPVDYYLAIDFEGFKQAVDTLDGVEIAVARSFTDNLYPVDGKEEDLCGTSPDDLEKLDELFAVATESPELAFPCRYETLSFSSGEQHMDGATALKYVRSRHAPEDGGDFGRAHRQQLFLSAIKDKVLSVGFIPKVIPLINDLEGNVKTDIPIDLVNKFLKEAPKSDRYGVTQVVLTTDNYLRDAYSDDKQYILIPKSGEGIWTKLQKDLQNIIAGLSPTPSPKPLP